jgi:hypothetical protein
MLKVIAALAATTFFAALPGNAQEPYSKLRNSGPTTLVITFRCKPENRVALREPTLRVGLAQLEGYKSRVCCRITRFCSTATWIQILMTCCSC